MSSMASDPWWEKYVGRRFRPPKRAGIFVSWHRESSFLVLGRCDSDSKRLVRVLFEDPPPGADRMVFYVTARELRLCTPLDEGGGDR